MCKCEELATFWLRHSIRMLKSLAARRPLPCSLLLAAFAVGCSATPEIEPLVTTYPKDRVEEVTNVVNLPLPLQLMSKLKLSGGTAGKPVDEQAAYSPGTQILQGTFTDTVVGDSAEKEQWIVPTRVREANEQFLMGLVEKGGTRACKGGFRVKDTKFYYGTEATLRHMGIQSPAVFARYRCTATRKPVADEDVKLVDRLSSKVTDAAYFDISTFFLPATTDSMINALKAVSDHHSMRIIDSGTRGRIRYLVASRGQQSAHPESMVAAVRQDREGSRLSLLYMIYEQTYHYRGTAGAGTKSRGYIKGRQPVSRDAAYKASRVLAEEVAAAAGIK